MIFYDVFTSDGDDRVSVMAYLRMGIEKYYIIHTLIVETRQWPAKRAFVILAQMTLADTNADK
ncbi:hypothetical protein PAXRUDRAFT_741778 [Paxillus rubicundulus Ve08.2h10]|uniref:Uncharacterized protein n=1 Tax=Paxillus rubicundulus Ve08.2h10 TaxID=930991 RepID=A0A0D0EBP1_9AGAM|nr:hypothetical protein PAXRUDRAFT_741778 [Paxillus rubicundulus Ve08.2h10]